MWFDPMRLKVLKWGLELAARTSYRKFRIATRNPERTQRDVLNRILALNAGTVFGAHHDFGRLKDGRDFARAVPVLDYEDLRPDVERHMAGESNVLTAEPVTMFAMTSGTTGLPKYIPVTPESDRRASTLMRLWLYGCLRSHPTCFDHGTAAIASPAVESLSPAGIPCGNVSGRIQSRLPSFIKRSYVVPTEAMCVADYDQRYFALARFLYARPPSAIGTPNASTLIRIAQVASERAVELIRGIHDGTLGFEPDSWTPDLEVMRPLLSADAARARLLEQVLESTGALKPALAWGHLKLIGCWLGGSAGLQVPLLRDEYGDVVLRDLGYLASEGRMTLPLADGTPSGVLGLDQAYYEFVPVDPWGEPRGNAVGAAQIESGQDYSVLLTTFGGLYRYDINDIVRVTGRYQRTPEIEFVRKGKDMVNLQGEKLHFNHLRSAVAACRTDQGLDITDYRLVPLANGRGYVFQMEAPVTLSRPALQELGIVLDRALGEQNVEYRAKRDSSRLEPIVIHEMSPGWRVRAMHRSLAGGRSDIQFKWRYLLPHPADSQDEPPLRIVPPRETRSGADDPDPLTRTAPGPKSAGRMEAA